MQFTTNSEKNTQFNLNANTDKKAEAGLSFSQKNATEEQHTKQIFIFIVSNIRTTTFYQRFKCFFDIIPLGQQC